jgi:excisionase family DNA binding protein
MKHLTYSQAAEFLNVKVPTLRSMVCRRQVPHIRLSGKMVRFDADELERWLRGKAVNDEREQR